MATILLAIPVLVAGGVAWWTMQHRSPDGAFHAELAPVADRIVVVPDVDALLRRDAPIARAERTQLRVQVDGAFIAMADPADLATYLAGSNYTELVQTNLARGRLPVQTRAIQSDGQPLAPFQDQFFWVRGAASQLQWTPADDRGRHVALVVIAPPDAGQVTLRVAVTAGWLDSTAWGLLILGPVLLLLGLAALAWPQRPREIVYVMDPAAAAQAGLSAGPHQVAPAAVVPAAVVPGTVLPGAVVPGTVLPGAVVPGTVLPGAHEIPAPRAAVPAPPTLAAPQTPDAPQTFPAPSAESDDCGLAILPGFESRVGTVYYSASAGVDPQARGGDGDEAAGADADEAYGAEHESDSDGGDYGGDFDAAAGEGLDWPPAEGPHRTQAARDIPMPTAGMALHLTRKS